MSKINKSLKMLWRNTWRNATLATCVILPGAIFGSQPVFADGTDILGPTSEVLAEGSRIIGAGTGLSVAQPGDIEIEIPAGVTVEQVLIYWDGADRDYWDGSVRDYPNDAPIIGVTTDTINVSAGGSDYPVEGVFIGGRTFRNVVQHFAFRADITSLGLVSPGSNTLSISGLDFGIDSVETGAGVLVIVDDGTSSTLGIFDGSDYAHARCIEDGLCMETVKRTFSFPAANSARDAELAMFFTSIAGTVSGGDFRPSVVRVWVGGAPPIELVDKLDSLDGEEWDTLNLEFEVPAGVTQIEVQAFSEDVSNTAANPASFKWLTAAFSVPDELDGGQGCTPGYWKQEHHFADWTLPYQPDDLFSEHFEDAFPGLTMVEVADGNGGGLVALGRHTVAAVLNAANPEVSYDMTPQQVIDAFNAVYPGSKGDYETLKNEFEDLNEQGCPLNNSDGSNNSNGNGNQSNANSAATSNSTKPKKSSATLGNQSSGGGAFGLWGILAFLTIGSRFLLDGRRQQ